MKDNSFAGGIGCTVLIFIAACVAVFGVMRLSPRFAAEAAKDDMAEHTPAAPTAEQQAAGVTQVAGAVSEQALAEILRDLEKHDEAMADKVVQVAESGDAAQTVTAVSADWAGAALPCAFVALGLIGVAVLATRRGGE